MLKQQEQQSKVSAFDIYLREQLGLWTPQTKGVREKSKPPRSKHQEITEPVPPLGFDNIKPNSKHVFADVSFLLNARKMIHLLDDIEYVILPDQLYSELATSSFENFRKEIYEHFKLWKKRLTVPQELYSAITEVLHGIHTKLISVSEYIERYGSTLKDYLAELTVYILSKFRPGFRKRFSWGSQIITQMVVLARTWGVSILAYGRTILKILRRAFGLKYSDVHPLLPAEGF